MMTFAEAETEINRRAHKVQFGPVGAQAYEPREKVIQIAKAFPEETEALWRGIETGAVTVEDYFAGWLGLISRFEGQIFFQQAEEKLIAMRGYDQKALALET